MGIRSGNRVVTACVTLSVIVSHLLSVIAETARVVEQLAPATHEFVIESQLKDLRPARSAK